MTQEEGGTDKLPTLKENVVKRYWRAVFAFKRDDIWPETLSYTLEAESLNRAYMMALDDRQEIARIMDIPADDVLVKSVTRFMPSSDSE